jgi:hypothetical protein
MARGCSQGPYVPLKAGAAEIRLAPVADDDGCTREQGACSFGDRNIDVVVLHPNASDVLRRINSTTGADPADGQVRETPCWPRSWANCSAVHSSCCIPR